jgi:hypothetical protein
VRLFYVLTFCCCGLILSCRNNPVSPSAGSGYTSINELGKAYYLYLTTNQPDSAIKNCLIDENEFSNLVNDSIAFYNDTIVNLGGKHYIIYDTLWNRDTILAPPGGASAITDPLYIHSTGRVYISDSISSICIHRKKMIPLNYSQYLIPQFKKAFKQLSDTFVYSSTAIADSALYVDTTHNLPKNIYPSLKYPEIKSVVYGALSPKYFTYTQNRNMISLIPFAKMVVKHQNTWKILLPSGFPDTLNWGTYVPAESTVVKPLQIVGLWENGNENISFQFNANDSFFVKTPAKSIAGLYKINDTIHTTYYDSLVIGQFAYRDPVNRNRWHLTPTSRQDTLRKSDSIIFPEMANRSLPTFDSLKVATYPIWIYSTTYSIVGETYNPDAIKLKWKNGSQQDSCWFYYHMTGLQNTGIDSLTLTRSNLIEDCRMTRTPVAIFYSGFRRLTSTSDSSWEIIKQMGKRLIKK